MSTKSEQDALLAKAEEVQLPNYRPAPFVLTRGEGCRVWDVAGRRYLDLSGGIAVTSVGHSHPTLARAIAEQAARLTHVSNLFYNDRAIELASEIVARSPFDRVYFCNSGAEANESLLKIARRWHHEQGHKGRTDIITMDKSFHGRTMGALSLTGQPKYHVGMGPMVGGIHHVPFNDIDALRAAVGPTTAAVLLEPVQAEGGVIPATHAYLEAAREICDAAGALLLFDEVQTGYGRIGPFLACQHYGVVPDACALAKGIGGGFPLAAMAVTERLAGGLPPGSHAATFGGGALACAAGLAVLRIFDEEHVLEKAQKTGDYLGERLAAIVASSAAVTDSRGLGLLRGMKLASHVDPGALLTMLADRGVLATTAGGDVLRLVPALTITRDELDEGLEVIATALSAAPEKAA